MPSLHVQNTITGDVRTVLKKHGFAQNSVLGQSQHTPGRTVLTGLYPPSGLVGAPGDAPAHHSHVAGGKKSSGTTGLQQPPLPTGVGSVPLPTPAMLAQPGGVQPLRSWGEARRSTTRPMCRTKAELSSQTAPGNTDQS